MALFLQGCFVYLLSQLLSCRFLQKTSRCVCTSLESQAVQTTSCMLLPASSFLISTLDQIHGELSFSILSAPDWLTFQALDPSLYEHLHKNHKGGTDKSFQKTFHRFQRYQQTQSYSHSKGRFYQQLFFPAFQIVSSFVKNGAGLRLLTGPVNQSLHPFFILIFRVCNRSSRIVRSFQFVFVVHNICFMVRK